jgi:3-dehydroquinate dehydratase-2
VADVLVLNGPNLNLLGHREPGHYGTQTLGDVEELCRRTGSELGLGVEFLQSNHEGVLIDRIHAAGDEYRAGTLLGAVFNPGALSHTSIALHDAITGVQLLMIEVHISNIHRRETFRQHSYISPAAGGVIVGLGTAGYEWAIRALAAKEGQYQ